MAGGADHRLAAHAGIGLLRCLDGRGTRVGMQMHAIGARVESDLSRTVDKDAGMTFGAAHGFNNARGKRLQFGERKIFFADLNRCRRRRAPIPRRAKPGERASRFRRRLSKRLLVMA